MALYDVPVDRRFTVLTHTQHPLYSKNAFKQVGNTTIPANPISANRVAPSAIYNPKLSGVGEAGYGRAFPYRGLSYPGAGSPRSSILRGLSYAGAGSPRTSVRGLSYAGAGSPRTSIYRPGLSYAGAGSPRASVRDSYINDNPPPGTLRVIPPKLSGLRDDVIVPVDTGTSMGPSLPASTAPSASSVWSDITGAFGSLFTTTVSAGTVAADTSIIGAITGSGRTSPQTPTTVAHPALSSAMFGIPSSTLMILGLGALAYMVIKK